MAIPDVSLVTKPENVAAVPELIKRINALANGTGDEARHALKEAARDLHLALETPREAMIRHIWSEPGVFVALTACERSGVSKYLVENEDGPFDPDEVAKATGVDPSLLCRFMRHLAAMGYLKEVGKNRYNLTNLMRSLALPLIGDTYTCMSEGCNPAIDQFHLWAAKNDWRTPTGVVNGPLQMAFKTELSFFEHLHNVGVGERFNSMMMAYHQGRASWMDNNFYPVKERLVEGFDHSEDAAMLVDIGGNMGHDLEEFHRKHPEAPGRLVLQDLPVIIGQIKQLDSRVEPMAYDFHTEQPVKGARAYFMHSVLHDWDEPTCLSILKNITDAMKPGYSKLLINENIITDTGAFSEHTALDMMMVTLLASKERTQADWDDLLGKAGLKITGVYTVARSAESLIECELADEHAHNGNGIHKSNGNGVHASNGNGFHDLNGNGIHDSNANDVEGEDHSNGHANGDGSNNGHGHNEVKANGHDGEANGNGAGATNGQRQEVKPS